MVMLHNAGFSPRDWELAPQYASPVSKPGVVVLDFDVLGELAKTEISSFRATQDETLAMAPLFVDDLPAAFYRINTRHPQFTPNHNTSERETIVVMKGVLKLVLNDAPRSEETDGGLLNTFYMGDVVELEDRAVSMQAIGVIDPASITDPETAPKPASCLALALYRDGDIQIVSLPS
jgi:hypothetical protein